MNTASPCCSGFSEDLASAPCLPPAFQVSWSLQSYIILGASLLLLVAVLLLSQRSKTANCPHAFFIYERVFSPFISTPLIHVFPIFFYLFLFYWDFVSKKKTQKTHASIQLKSPNSFLALIAQHSQPLVFPQRKKVCQYKHTSFMAKRSHSPLWQCFCFLGNNFCRGNN